MTITILINKNYCIKKSIFVNMLILFGPIREDYARTKIYKRVHLLPAWLAQIELVRL